jgi:hypothetical protein
MDIEKTLKVVETYLRDYVFSLLAILASPWSVESLKSVNDELSARSGRTWLFALISVILGGVAFAAGRSADFSAVPIAGVWLVLTIWLWILTSSISHLLARLVSGKGKFLDTLGVCIRVFATAYVVAGLMAMTVGFFSRAAFETYAGIAAIAFLITQFLILAVYIPTTLGEVHGLQLRARLPLAIAIPALVAGVNATGIFLINGNAPMAPPPAASTAPPLMAPMVRMGPLKIDTNLQGYDFDAFGKPAANAQLCAEMCRNDNECEAMTFVKSTGRCWLKSDVPEETADADMISSIKRK